ncbi:MAG: hypothetical protein ACE5I9_04935 [Candidatus Methylomirabilales bacterium]
MQRILLHSFGVVLTLLIALSPAGENIAEGQESLNAQLRGDFAYTIFRGCINAFDGLDEQLRLLGFGAPNTFVARGIVRFNRDGTGTADRFLLAIVSVPSPGAIPVTEGESTCDLTHTANPDGSITQAWQCAGIVTVGNRAGQNFTVDGIEFQSRISKGGRVLLLSDTDARVETITFQGGTPLQRICNRSGIAIKIRQP